MSIQSVLIANRGEIAVRIIKTLAKMGLRSVAVYSDADKEALHVQLADEAVRIGPAPVGESYLRIDAILEAARDSGADAIHPGYGFLSENADFAQAVVDAGLIFVGPASGSIRSMGDKAIARQMMLQAGVPCVPGYDGDDQRDQRLIIEGEAIGLPLMVKAAAGGGGRGMRLVTEPGQLAEALSMARNEAAQAFGADRLILEKAVLGARHVEIQVFADTHGNCVFLGERDCSLQRRHQKVIEEAPAPGMADDLRRAMGEAAVEAARTVEYVGAGTVEFLLGSDGSFYFLEMNTRLQVEHPVTELVTGLDLVELQIRVARGEPLGLTQGDVTLRGHAIEARLYAEDPDNDFLPATGDIRLWKTASGAGVRVDEGIVEGQVVSPHYDPMLAKVMGYGATREEARARLKAALAETVLLGTVTNTAFLVDLLDQPDFVAGHPHTGLIDAQWPRESDDDAGPDAQICVIAAALVAEFERDALATQMVTRDSTLFGWTSAPLSAFPVRLRCGARDMELALRGSGRGWEVADGEGVVHVELHNLGGGLFEARVGRARVRFHGVAGARDEVFLGVGAARYQFVRLRAGGAAGDAQAGGAILSPMPGKLTDVMVAEGDIVAVGQTLAVVEAMKMQHQVSASIAGKVTRIAAAVGDQMAGAALIMTVEEDDT